MRFDERKLREAIDSLLPGGVSEIEFDEILESASIPRRQKVTVDNASTTPLSKLLSERSLVADWVARADASQDPDILLLRKLTVDQRDRVLALAKSVAFKKPWDRIMSDSELVLPPDDSEQVQCISISDLQTNGHPLSRIAPWLAKTALRVSIEYRVRPEFAFGYLLDDDLWSRPSPVEFSIERLGENPLDATIYIEVDPSATDDQIWEAICKARQELGIECSGTARRRCKPKTFALAMFFSYMISGGDFPSTKVPWRELMDIWNAFCSKDLPKEWGYGQDTYRSNRVHQFARDTTDALESVRGSQTRFSVEGARNRKLRN